MRKLQNSYAAFFSAFVLINLVGINQADIFDGCDGTYNLSPGLNYLESPNYPLNYTSGSSCRYRFIAPLDYDITVNCTINLDKNPNSCSTEYLYISVEGDPKLFGSENFCGQGQFKRKSLFRKLVIAYLSYGSTGRFKCHLFVGKQPCDCGWSVNTKIVNGEETKAHEYPSMVAIRDRQAYVNVSCGGSIISHRYIVTAAHCTQMQPIASNLLACVGRHDITKGSETEYAENYEIERIIQHPYYIPDPVKNDIALLLTKKDIEWSRGVGPICLPFTQTRNDFAYYNVDVIGWGTTSFGGPLSKALRKVSLQILKNFDCQRQTGFVIYPSEVCTYDNFGKGRDSCQFDSGGPIIMRTSRQFFIGIISFGTVCGQGGYAIGVNTRITSYLNWIYQNTGNQNYCSKKL